MKNIRNLDAYDVVIAGGGPGGIPAAIAAARRGRRVLLVEQNAFLGGVAATGLPLLAFCDRTGRQVVKGIADELVVRLRKLGASFAGHLPCPIHNSFTPVNPYVLRSVALDMCVESGVDLLFSTGFMDVDVSDGQITGVVLFSKSIIYRVPCKVLVDATGDGAVAHLAGALYEMGDVSHGKTQPVSLIFSLGNVAVDELLDYIRTHPSTFETPATYGKGIDYNLAYFLDNESFYFTGFQEFINKARQNGEFDIPRDRVIFAKQPNPGEIVVNATRMLYIDPTDPLSLSRAEVEGHRQVLHLVNFFKKYCPGFGNCFLANIASGTSARESRRIVGYKTITKAAIDQLLVPGDSIALAGYNVDIHQSGVGLHLLPAEHAIGIPYGCLVSKNIDGLLASGRCISVEPYPFGLTRAMATCMAVGEAAGTAAAMAVEKGIAPSRLDVGELRRILKANGAVVE